MTTYNLSTRRFFIELIKDHHPELIFRGKSRADFDDWHAAFKKRFIGCLGPFPKAVPLTHSVEWEVREEGLIKQRVVLQTALHTAVPAIVLRPDDDKPVPGILAIHGHGDFGKDWVVGAKYHEADKLPEPYRRDFGIKLARQGFAVIAPDLRPFGERSDAANFDGTIGDRDPCNVHAIKGWLLGFNLLTYNLWDLMKSIDYLVAQKNIVPDKVGVIGFSGGGAAAMHLAAYDSRVAATSIVCALNSYRDWAIGIDNFCGTQFLPGMFKYGDHAEICGLIAPRALSFEIGGFDYQFPSEASMAALKRVEAIYQAAGCSEKLSSYVGFGGHQCYNANTAEFFRKWLP